LYQPGEEDSLDYHELVTGFLHQLCKVTGASAYCRTAANFERDLKTPPVLRVLTRRLRADKASALRFQVSKISRVGITLIWHGHTEFLTSGNFTYGRHSFALPALKHVGTWTVRLDATDLAGNYKQMASQVQVMR
jgi:hypothetical protein